ncbi:MAG TPA: NrdH-redoxin [Ruminococcus sp.]|nr:NrdH-redoxin [Ruminococcus sp.]HBN10440.1 NrdH-redoxin [Ruminococcus sp.]HCR73421.1 NrdH-redoxin [Ruminococcus sp.]
MIKVYSSDSCGYCQKLKAYLDSRNINYTVIDVNASEDNAYELIRLTGQSAIPVTIIGDETIIGFDKPAIDKALENYKN